MLLHLPVFRQWWRVTLETGQDMCAMWITQTAMGGVSHAYITLIKIGVPRYVSDVWRKCCSLVLDDDYFNLNLKLYFF